MKPALNDPSRALAYFQQKVQFTIGPVEVSHWVDDHEAVNIVDVRQAEDYEKAHVPGAINLPKDRWNDTSALKKDRLNLLYCYTQQCHLAANAAVQFAAKGFSVMEMEGGFAAWADGGQKTESGRAMAGAAR